MYNNKLCIENTLLESKYPNPLQCKIWPIFLHKPTIYNYYYHNKWEEIERGGRREVRGRKGT